MSTSASHSNSAFGSRLGLADQALDKTISQCCRREPRSVALHGSIRFHELPGRCDRECSLRTGSWKLMSSFSDATGNPEVPRADGVESATDCKGLQ